MALYALEGWLDRLSVSQWNGDLVLKGGVLLAAYNARRPTRDVDLQAQAMTNDEPTILAMVQRIAAIPRDDGLHYNHAFATAETIRDDDQYSGVRVTMSCQLATARLRFHVDVNVGDPVWPAAAEVELPRLLGGTITVRGYPLSMVHAEKIVTAVERGTASTRWRDYADLYLLSRQHDADGNELQGSLAHVAEHRDAQLTTLTEALQGYAALGQDRWAAWVRKQRLTDRLPNRFADVLEAVALFADTPLTGRANDRTWRASTQSWS